MRKFYLLIILFIFSTAAYSVDMPRDVKADSVEVNRLNLEAYKSRLTDPEQTVTKAMRALELAKELNYTDGIAEAYRTIGIGQYYSNQAEKAIDNYLTALSYFKKTHDLLGQARVYNNIGNLYHDSDYDRSLEYLEKGLQMAGKLNNTELLASLYLNIGNVYTRKKSYSKALEYYSKSNDLFVKLNEPINLILCLQNIGVLYYNLKEYPKAEKLLLKANAEAKLQDLNTAIGSIDLTLIALYIELNQLANAEKFLIEGKTFAQLTKDHKLIADFTYSSYELEHKRGNFEKALNYLHELYQRDSTTLKTHVSSGLGLLQEQHIQQEKQRENELIIAKQKYNSVKLTALVIVAGLLSVVIGLLILNVKRKNQSNIRLTELNGEVNRQKDNLDRINHHLEEIIDERTQDLQIKNKKLSEYSSYLSHQIRGPIATLKGLMNLEKEGLVDQQECINMMNKCVSEIDERIIDMSDMLHDPHRTGIKT